MSNVVSLNGNPSRAEVNQETVDILRQLLADAEAGIVLGVMYVTAKADGFNACGWTALPDGLSFAQGFIHLTYRYGASIGCDHD